MKWTVTMNSKEYVDYGGVVHKADTKTFECPFEYRQDIYYAYPKERLFRKTQWVLIKTRISSIWVTNCFGVCLEYNGNHIPEEWFYRLFTDKEAAIEFCLKKNQHSTVKIYNNK